MASEASNSQASVFQGRHTYGWYVVAVLFLAYTFSYVDRTILTLLVNPIRQTLAISDTQVSLLHGMAFALFYTVLGIPIARIADRSRRVVLISSGVALWSGMTVLGGLARSFGQLFTARVGVGVGEAALGPAAYSLLSDYFRGPALTRALSVYTSATYIGAGVALVIGGAVISAVPGLDFPGVGHLEPWQVVFLFVGFPGIAVSLWMLTIREPARRGRHVGARGFAISEVARFIKERRGAYGFLISGFAAASLVWNGANAWIPTFFIRTFHWGPATIGLRYGIILSLFGTVGVVVGGTVGNYLARRGRSDANLIVGIIAAFIVLPSGILAPLQSDPFASLAIFTVFVVGGSMPYGAAAASFQQITPNQMRGQVTAVYFFFVNAAGIGLGPTVIALLTEHVFHNELALKYSIAVVVALASPLSALLLWRGLGPFRRCVGQGIGE